MNATQTEPLRRKLTLSRETVRTLGGPSRDLTAAEMATRPCVQPPTEETVGCMPSTWWCP